MNDNKKIVQDIKHTGDEAARLLKDLEKSSTAQNGTQKSDNVRTKLENPNKVNRLDSNANSNTLVGPAIVVSGLIIFLAVAFNMSITNNASNPSTVDTTSESIPLTVNKSSDSNPGSVEKKKRLMNNAQRDFYHQTLYKASEAVLVREHNAAISDLNMLYRGDFRGLSDIDRALVKDLISQARKEIKFLDQPGKHKYWERSNYGVQWFDEVKDSQFYVFFAYSKKCKNPLVTFRLSEESESPDYKTYQLRPKTNTSTLRVPLLFSGYQYINVLNFKCN